MAIAPITFLYGPTASGKSSMALRWADRHDGIIINSDALQIYDALPILTAQPPASDQAQAPHFLYGMHDPLKPMNAHLWAEKAISLLGDRPAIIVGGTGLYLKTLIEGLSPIPQTPIEIRQDAEQDYRGMGAQEFHTVLKEVDPLSATRIHPHNKQRMIRAMEVYKNTGKAYSWWCDQPKKSLLPDNLPYEFMVLLPEKEIVIERASKRFDIMHQQNVIAEVKDYTKRYPKGSFSDQALGLKALQAYINKEISLEDAKARLLKDTNNFIKRQYTWARGQILEHYDCTIFDHPDQY